MELTDIQNDCDYVVNSDKWKIMAIHKSGKVEYGSMIFRSEQACHAHWKTKPVQDWVNRTGCNTYFPIPVE